MAYITKIALSTASQEIKKANNLSADAIKIKEKIDTFVSTSKVKLRGGGFDALRAKLTYYSEIYNLVSELCSLVSNNCTSVNNSMSNYMEPYILLDDELVDTIKSKISDAREDLGKLEEFSAQYKDLSADIADLLEKCKKLEGLRPEDNMLHSKLAPTREEVKKLFNYVDNIPMSNVGE